MLARMNIFPSEVLKGRYARIPFEERTCNLCGLEPDSVTHILCHCPELRDLRDRTLGPIISDFPGPPQFLTGFLLHDFSQEITTLVAEFLAQVLTSQSSKN